MTLCIVPFGTSPLRLGLGHASCDFGSLARERVDHFDGLLRRRIEFKDLDISKPHIHEIQKGVWLDLGNPITRDKGNLSWIEAINAGKDIAAPSTEWQQPIMSSPS
jgi:hypothetical protein